MNGAVAERFNRGGLQESAAFEAQKGHGFNQHPRGTQQVILVIREGKGARRKNISWGKGESSNCLRP